MRILVLHSSYASGASSGENRVVEDEVRLLADAGHAVEWFSPCAAAVSKARAGVNAVWSGGAVREVRRALSAFRPDVVHCHNLFPMLSPAVLREAAGHTPVVMTLHNFRLLCLPATLLRNGVVCEDCLGRVPWRGVARRCYRGSFAGSAALAVSLTVHQALRTFAAVDRYLAVSRFVRAKHVEAGFAPDQIRVKPNFAWPVPERDRPGGAFLYVGRLSPEKGVSALLEAWRTVDAPLIVAGDGPDASRLHAQAPPNVTFLGEVQREAVPRLMTEARALLVPSVWYEGAPRAVLEAYAAGTPVIASRIGGFEELVEHGVTGYLVTPGKTDEWSDAVTRLGDPAGNARLGRAAFEAWQEFYSPDRALQQLELAYSDARMAAHQRALGTGFVSARSLDPHTPQVGAQIERGLDERGATRLGGGKR
jgi:glycosyltransferase involved in cell wall biosynthesis